MFNLLVDPARVEPLEIWTAAERTRYEKHATDQHRKAIKSASLTAASLLVVCVLIPLCSSPTVSRTPSDAGQSLVFLAFALLLWLVVKAAMVYFSGIRVAEARRQAHSLEMSVVPPSGSGVPISLELASRAKVEN